MVGDAVMLSDENMLSWLPDNETPFEDEDIIELLMNVTTELEDENQPGWVVGCENELTQEDEISILIVDVAVLDKVKKVGRMLTDFVVVEDEDKHVWL